MGAGIDCRRHFSKRPFSGCCGLIGFKTPNVFSRFFHCWADCQGFTTKLKCHLKAISNRHKIKKKSRRKALAFFCFFLWIKTNLRQSLSFMIRMKNESEKIIFFFDYFCHYEGEIFRDLTLKNLRDWVSNLDVHLFVQGKTFWSFPEVSISIKNAVEHFSGATNGPQIHSSFWINDKFCRKLS